MLNDFILIFVGCIHFFLQDSEFLPLVDAVAVPVLVVCTLLFIFALVLRLFTAIYRALFSNTSDKGGF